MEKQNKQRLEQLVRQGIVPSRKLPMLMKAMTSLQMGKQLMPTERDILAKYMHNMTDIMLKDTTVFNRAKLHTQRTKYQTEDTTVDSLDEKMVDGVKILDGPEDEERMRHTAQTKAKKLSIKKRDKFRLLSPEVKREKLKAGVEEEVKSMHEHYKNMFEAALEVYGVSNVRDIPADKKKEFFAVVDEAAKMDPVGQEDADVDNDGDSDSSDAYLKKRRKAIAKAMKKEEVEQVNEYITSKQVKMAKGIANDPRHKGGDYAGAAEKMEKIKKGLSNHPAAKKALRQANEETEQLDEYGNPVAKPSMVDKVKMVAKKRAKTGLTMEDAASDARRDYAADDKRGMAPLKKDEPKPAEPKKQKGRSADHAKHEHIVQQMHKAITVGKPVTFKDGSSHKVDKVHAYKFLHKTMQMKPAERLKAHTDAHASHDNFKKHV